MRAYEFVADHLGDWAIHCHKSHHTMNAMGHDVPTLIGTSSSNMTRQVRRVQPDDVHAYKASCRPRPNENRAGARRGSAPCRG